MEINQVTSLRAGDLAGLTGLRYLNIGAPVSSLPAGIFDDLTGLNFLAIYHTKLTTLPAGIFDNLTNLRTLYLDSNPLLASLPAGIFDNLYLHDLYLKDNALTTLPAGIFDRVRIAVDLHLGGNPFTSLPAGILDRFSGRRSSYVRGDIPNSLLPKIISLTPAALKITEGNRENPDAVFQVKVLNKYSTQSFSVNYATQDGTAIAGEDYTAVSGTLTSGQIIFIPILDDDVTNELPKTFTLTLSNPTNAVFLGGASQLTATVTIIDDEEPPTVSFSNVPLNAHILKIPEGDEGATNAVFQVELDQAPSSPPKPIPFFTPRSTAGQPPAKTTPKPAARLPSSPSPTTSPKPSPFPS